MGYKAYSDSYLMSLTKAQIIELLRVAEHNFFATEEALNNSAKAGMEIAEKYDEAKRLLKMAVEDFKEINSDILTCKCCKWYSAETDECTFYPDDTPCEQICGWKHEGEALKLIGEDENET